MLRVWSAIALVMLAPAVSDSASIAPTVADMDDALRAAPEVALAHAQLEEAQAQARIETTSTSGWLARGTVQSRRVTGEQDFREWDMSMEHGVRLPRKRQLDQSIAELQLRRAEAMVADARRTATLDILERWYQCVAAAVRVSRAADQLQVAAALEESVIKRHKAGEAAQMEVNLAAAERAALQASELAASEGLRSAIGLMQMRGLVHPCEASTADGPPATTIPAPGKQDRDPAIRAVAASTELARARAERARAERWADPSVGVRYAQERGGLERIAGVFVTIPLPSSRLAAEADRAAAQVHIADSAQRQAEIQLAVRNADALGRVRLARAQSHALNEASTLQTHAAQQAQRAYTLGETDLATALMALRTAYSAQALAQDSVVEAWRADSLARTLLEFE